jgi:tetraacyldisaccharide 4'-kinase
MSEERPSWALRRAGLVRAWRAGRLRGLRWALAPAAWCYRFGLGARDLAYAEGIRRRARLACPVVSVGNLTVGGTGKTPVVELIARRLAAEGRRVAVVSRGYGRRGTATAVVTEGGRPLLPVEEAGDEPLLLARRVPGVAVVVGADRLAAGRWAVERVGAEVVVLDDGFQQRRLVKDVEVVCLDARAPWGPGGLFPLGTLREPPGALGRAHLVVLTHVEACPGVPSLVAQVRALAPSAPCVLAEYTTEDLLDPLTGAVQPVAALRDRAVLAFAGIADPGALVATLRGAGARVHALVGFPDHHGYGRSDRALLARRAAAAGADLLVTTEKDAVRLGPLLAGDGTLPPILVLRVRLELAGEVERWWETLRGRLTARPAGGSCA